MQQPHPPIRIGGNGEKRTLCTAARFAQHWNFGAAAAVAALGEAGAEPAIVSRSPPHTPAVLEPLASALAELSAGRLSPPGEDGT